MEFNILSIFLALLLSYVAAAHKVFPHWSQKNNTTSLFIITFHCCTVRGSNQLAFRVRRAATCPFTSMDQHLSLTIIVSKMYLMMRIKDVFFSRHRISQFNITYLVMTDCKKQEKISLFKQVLREIAMVSLESP